MKRLIINIRIWLHMRFEPTCSILDKWNDREVWKYTGIRHQIYKSLKIPPELFGRDRVSGKQLTVEAIEAGAKAIIDAYPYSPIEIKSRK